MYHKPPINLTKMPLVEYAVHLIPYLLKSLKLFAFYLRFVYVAKGIDTVKIETCSMVKRLTAKLFLIRLRQFCAIALMLTAANLYAADKDGSQASGTKLPPKPVAVNDAIDKALANVNARCESQYNDQAIEGARSQVPLSQRDTFDLTLIIRKNSECQCLPAKLKSLDATKLKLTSEKEYDSSLVHAIQPLLQDCVAETYKQQWLPFCDILMKPETGDQNKRLKACQCMQSTVNKITNSEMIAYAVVTYKNLNLDKQSTGAGNSVTSKLDNASRTCMKQAGINTNSNYKKHYVENNLNEANVAKAKADLKVLASALFLYKLDFNRYPSQQQGLAILLQANKSPKSNKSLDPYLKKLPKDGWGNDYQYKISPDGNSVLLSCYGRDGKPGGSEFDQDIVQEVK